MTKDGSEYARLADLNGTCGAHSAYGYLPPLLAGSDGTLFGVTADGANWA